MDDEKALSGDDERSPAGDGEDYWVTSRTQRMRKDNFALLDAIEITLFFAAVKIPIWVFTIVSNS